MADLVDVTLLPKLFSALLKIGDERQSELQRIRDTLGVDHRILSKFYVPPRCQAISKYSERSKYSKPLYEVLNEFLSREIAAPGGGRNHFFVLADAGMGKTSLIAIVHFFSLTRFWPSDDFTKLEKLGPDSLERLQKVTNPGDCILLLDSVDEDPESWGNVEDRLLEILSATTKFKKVLITCRTQFFPSPLENDGYVRVGPFRCEATYISPFNDSEVAMYLEKRWPNRWPALLQKLPFESTRQNLKEQAEAKRLVQKMGELSSRPLLLANLEDIINAPESQGQWSAGPAYEYMSKVKPSEFLSNLLFATKTPGSISEYGLYKRLVDGWLDREYEKILQSNSDGPTAEELLEACLRIACFMQQPGRDPRIIKQQELETLRALHSELGRLTFLEIGGRSLLNKDGEGNLRFAHYSVQEFLVVRAILEAAAPTTEVPPGTTYATTQQMVRFFGQAAAKYRRNKFRASLLCFPGKDLSGCDLFEIDFTGTNLVGVNLDNSILLKANLSSVDCTNASFCGSLLSSANLKKTNLGQASLRKSILGFLPAFDKPELQKVSKIGAALLTGASFRGADLSGAVLDGCDLESADFTDAVGLPGHDDDDDDTGDRRQVVHA